MTAARHILVLGGARSGKSRFAQALAEAEPGELVYIATAEALDAEMADRIARHRADRGARWRTVECPLDLTATLAREQREGRVLLVDCLTLWLSNLMLAERDCAQVAADLAARLPGMAGTILLVSNEVGLGIVPENAVARRFRDEAGRLNQMVAQAVGQAWLLAAGLPLRLK